MICRYVRVLGAFYLRLTGIDTDVYQYLEPLYNDYRKLRRKLSDGSKTLNSSHCYFQLYVPVSSSFCKFRMVTLNDPVRCLSFFFLSDYSLTHVDEVIDELLTKDYSCDIAMPRIKKR